MVEKDYIMRIIHEMVRAMVKLIFHIEVKEGEELVFLEGEHQDFYQVLCQLADQGKINQAENMLFEKLEEEVVQEEGDGLKLALAFYDYLNTKENDFLDSNEYSREEIRDGIQNVMKMYGYSGLAETLLESR